MPVLESEGNQNTFKSGKENEKATKKMYECNLCPYSNKNPGTLYHHKKNKHNPDQIPCDECGKVFISRGYMQGHKSDVHDVATHVIFALRSSRKVK